jgi:hypothetical protein
MPALRMALHELIAVKNWVGGVLPVYYGIECGEIEIRA